MERGKTQIAKSPNTSAFYGILGTLLLGDKQIDQAEAALQKAIELDKNNMNAFILLARIQASRGSPDQAVASYQQMIQTHPQDVRPVMLLAMLEESQGHWQKAQGLYQKALQVQPDYPLAANNLAYLLLEHGGDTDVALRYAQVGPGGLAENRNIARTPALTCFKKGPQ